MQPFIHHTVTNKSARSFWLRAFNYGVHLEEKCRVNLVSFNRIRLPDTWLVAGRYRRRMAGSLLVQRPFLGELVFEDGELGWMNVPDRRIEPSLPLARSSCQGRCRVDTSWLGWRRNKVSERIPKFESAQLVWFLKRETFVSGACFKDLLFPFSSLELHHTFSRSSDESSQVLLRRFSRMALCLGCLI